MTATAPRHGALTLYISGASELSSRAIANATALCDEELGGHYDLAIVNVHDQPSLGLERHVVAAPTLIRNLPLPERRLVGDLSDVKKVLQALDLAGPALNGEVS